MDIYARKFELLEDSLRKLSEIRKANPTLGKYRISWKDRDAVERNLHKIIEAIIDIGKMLIAEKKFRGPANNREDFQILEENRIFPFILVPCVFLPVPGSLLLHPLSLCLSP